MTDFDDNVIYTEMQIFKRKQKSKRAYLAVLRKINFCSWTGDYYNKN